MIPAEWKISENMKNHIDEILKTGTMKVLEEALKNEKIMATRLLTKVHGG